MLDRTKVFILIVAACVVGAALYLRLAVESGRDEAARVVSGDPLPSLASEVVPEGPLVLFARQSGSPDGRDSSLGVVPLADLSTPRFEESLRCDRLHMSGGRGMCLQRRGRFPVEYVATMFDASFQVIGELPLGGAPSRTQVSPSGRFAAVTVFVTGHSYADGNFSTLTSIADLKTGRWAVNDLETFKVRRDGRVIEAADFNFWGVTFANDDQTFFATLGTAGKTLLVRGTVDSREVEVVEDGIECPSLSPDNRRVAFKHRVANGLGPAAWQIWVMDLDTRARHALSETRSVDDQVQWLDDDHILYSLPGDRPAVMDTWTVSADGQGAPRLFLPSSYSASVTRR